MAETRLSRLLSKEFSLKSNILANFAGNGLVAIVSIIALPFYLPLIGIEAYGLIGFFAAFQAILSVLDLGLGVTITKELAVRSAISGDSSGPRDLVRTSEAIYWGMAIVIGSLGLAFAPQLVRFVNPEILTPETLRDCFLLMSFSLALQFPMGLYSSGLYGLQRQAAVSVIGVLFALIRNFGVLAVLLWVSSTPRAFFGWQVLVSATHTMTLATVLWTALPASNRRAQFNKDVLKESWRFTAGIGAISIVSVLVTQVDKVVLARILPLDAFGYYSIAAVISGGLQRLVQPVFQAYFPKLSQLTAMSETLPLRDAYHKGCQLMAVIVMPISAVLIFFSREIVSLWQRNDETVTNTYVLVSILVAGSALNSLIFIPYALQLASGWTKLHLFAVSSAVIVAVPLTVVFGLTYGSIGAASVWIVVNAGFVFFNIPIMHRRLLQGEMWRWYLDDVLKPVLAAFLVAGAARIIFIDTASQTLITLQVSVILCLAFISAAAAAGRIRNWTLSKLGMAY